MGGGVAVIEHPVDLPRHQWSTSFELVQKVALVVQLILTENESHQRRRLRST
jgi:hypothetical protein